MKKQKHQYTCRRLTLIELLIVLGLLGGLATLAITSVGELDSTGRVNETERRLDMVRKAVAGDGVSAGRFIADMGRLPVVQNTDPGRVLDELWTDSGGLGYGDYSADIGHEHSMKWPEDDENGGLPEELSGLPGEVELRCGWNGPYVLTARDRLFDGFGNAFWIAQNDSPSAEDEWQNPDDETPSISTGETVHGILSPGRNREWDDGGDPADSRRSVVFGDLMPDTSLTVMVKARNLSNETGVWQNVTSVEPGNFGENENEDKYEHYITHLRVALFMPDVGDDTLRVDWDIDKQEKDGENHISSTVTLDDEKITPGIRKLYVYGYRENGGNGIENARASGPEPMTVELKPGSNFITVYLTHELDTEE